jgi:hypothetical protein
MAKPNSATAVPEGMYFTWGSRVRFPIRITRLKLAMIAFLLGCREKGEK